MNGYEAQLRIEELEVVVEQLIAAVEKIERFITGQVLVAVPRGPCMCPARVAGREAEQEEEPMVLSLPKTPSAGVAAAT